MSDLISRQAAIDAVNSRKTAEQCKEGEVRNWTVDACVDMIKQLPPIQPVNCSEFPNNSDAISRQSVIDVLDETRRIAERNIDGAVLMTFERVLDSLVNITNALPTIQPAEPKRGRWIYCEDSTADCVDGYRCDQCGFFVPWDYQHKGIDFIQDYNFCPHCGAKMGVTT